MARGVTLRPRLGAGLGTLRGEKLAQREFGEGRVRRGRLVGCLAQGWGGGAGMGREALLVRYDHAEVWPVSPLGQGPFPHAPPPQTTVSLHKSFLANP